MMSGLVESATGKPVAEEVKDLLNFERAGMVEVRVGGAREPCIDELEDIEGFESARTVGVGRTQAGPWLVPSSDEWRWGESGCLKATADKQVAAGEERECVGAVARVVSAEALAHGEPSRAVPSGDV